MSDHIRAAAKGLIRPTRWSADDPVAVGAGALAVIAAILTIAALDFAGAIVVPTVLGVLAAVALAPLARRIESTGAPAWLAAAGIVVGLLGAAAAAVYALAPSAESWLRRAPEILRQVESMLRDLLRTFGPGGGPGPRLRGGVPDPSQAGAQDAVEQLVDGGQQFAADLAISAPGLVGGAVYFALLTFFLLRDRASLARWLFRLGGSSGTRRAIARGMRDIQGNVSIYLLTISAMNVVVGVVVAAAFQIIGMPNAALWGAAAGVLNYMPLIGPAILCAVTLAVGLVSFPDPLIAIAPMLVILGVNAVEGQILTPLVIGARMRLSSLAVFVAIAFGAWLWGAAGALIATPTLIVAEAFLARRPPGGAVATPGARAKPIFARGAATAAAAGQAPLTRSGLSG